MSKKKQGPESFRNDCFEQA
uniref:Uncharacterized protein n=1 Tax=Arundo donax TaxID=35708 RepID=A0A0A9A551_ARUDO